MGMKEVETFIASGNVIFVAGRKKPAELECAIEVRLEKALGFPVGAFLRTIPEVAQVAARMPFPESDLVSGATVFVGFLKNVPPDGTLRALADFRSAAAEFSIRGREIYWLRRRSGEVFSGVRLEKTLGGVTFRNMTTIRKIAARYSEAPAKAEGEGRQQR